MDPAQAKLGAFAAGLAAIYAAETFFSARAWTAPRWRRLGVHLALAGLNTAVTRATVALPLLGFIGEVRGRGWGLMGWLGLSGPAELALTFAAFDLHTYWWHRANHELPWLWRFHRAHHLDDHVDVTTSLRFHPGELLLSAGVKALFVLLWGPSLWGFVLAEIGITAAAQFHHANVDLPGRWEPRLRRLVMTPRLHAGHHTVSLRSRDANYATVFLAWDRLFDSLEEPDPAEMRELGLPGPRPRLSLGTILRAPWA